jgi:hypothetical protein
MKKLTFLQWITLNILSVFFMAIYKYYALKRKFMWSIDKYLVARSHQAIGADLAHK